MAFKWRGALLLLAAQGVAGQPAPAGWPQFRGNPQLTGEAQDAPQPPLRVVWPFEAGEVVESSAAIADDTVYVGAQPGALFALSLANGAKKWKYAIEGDGVGESSPAVADGVVYVGDLNGLVHAVAAADGKPIWTFKT